jgi:hypothetical protein
MEQPVSRSHAEPPDPRPSPNGGELERLTIALRTAEKNACIPGNADLRIGPSSFVGNAPIGRSAFRASASEFGLRGESPLQARALRPVTEGNRVAARRGGEQPEVNVQSATKVNSIRPCRSVSLRNKGETQTGATWKSTTLRGSVIKRSWRRWGGWRRNGGMAKPMKQRDLPGPDGCS